MGHNRLCDLQWGGGSPDFDSIIKHNKELIEELIKGQMRKLQQPAHRFLTVQPLLFNF